jgi:putative ABC transport system permease protein
MSRRRSTWRLAARLVRRSPARSALIALLVALPVLAATFAAVAYRTAQLSPDQAANRSLGRADAVAVVTTNDRVDPTDSYVVRGNGYTGEPQSGEGPIGIGSREPSDVDLARLLPPDARITPAAPVVNVTLRSGRSSYGSIAIGVDLADPLTKGLIQLTSGHAPRGDGQVALTVPLARALHVGIGAHLVVDRRPVTVTAIARDPNSYAMQAVVGAAGTFGGVRAFTQNGAGQGLSYLVDFAGPAPDLHDSLAAHGVIYETRTQWEHPTPEEVAPVQRDPQVFAVLGSVALFGLIEILLLAGTAFAVGARRQVRELGLLRAVGGDESDVRRVVLAQGVVLGTGGTVLGLVLGVAAVPLLSGQLATYLDHAMGPLDVRPLELLAIALLGIVAAWLAAFVPARSSARYAVVDMLKTRFPVDGAVRTPRWAWVALTLGPITVIGSATAWHHSHFLDAASAVNRLTGGAGAAVSVGAHDARWTALISLGTAITLAGLTGLMPRLLARIARAARRLPLAPRLALRDAGRHWHRTAPATAAVATVVAGSVLVLFIASSTDVRDRRGYQPSIPVGAVSLGLLNQPDPTVLSPAAARTLAHTELAQLSAVTTRAAAAVHARFAATFAYVHPAATYDSIGLAARGCNARRQTCTIGDLAVGTGDAVAALAGRPLPAIQAALDRGEVVVFEPSLVHNGRVRIEIDHESAANVRASVLSVPAVAARIRLYAEYPAALAPESLVTAQHWLAQPQTGLLRPVHAPASSTVHRLEAALGTSTYLSVERGYQRNFGLALLLLFLATGLATLAGTSIAVALAMAESRADMATMAAVGASPGRRRLHAMAQAATVGGLGATLGVLLGGLVGLALVQGSTTYPFTVPVAWIAELAVLAPLLAVLVAGAVTRGEVAMTRRLA